VRENDFDSAVYVVKRLHQIRPVEGRKEKHKRGGGSVMGGGRGEFTLLGTNIRV